MRISLLPRLELPTTMPKWLVGIRLVPMIMSGARKRCPCGVEITLLSPLEVLSSCGRITKFRPAS